MAIRLTTTKQAAVEQGLKVLVHGLAGAGKTVLCSTTGEPTLIISAEAGLLSLRHTDMPVIEVKSLQDVKDAYQFITEAKEAEQFRWICLDSISEIAEVVLAAEKAATKDPRKAYGELQDHMMTLMRAFRDLAGRNVVFTAKQEKLKDEHSGMVLYQPMMPGQKLSQQIGYLFDMVFALRVEKDQDGDLTRWLQTSRDLQFEAKDRSGALAMFEPPNLEAIAAKIRGDAPSHQPIAATN